MIVITKRYLIDKVAERWRGQYFKDGLWSPDSRWSVEDKEPIYLELLALPHGASEAQVTAIIGNGSWTRNTCDECGKDVGLTVIVGNRPYCERAINICLDCLKSAVVLAETMERAKTEATNEPA